MRRDEAIIRTLMASIENDLAAIERIILDINKLKCEIANAEPGIKEKATMGYFLHNLYCAFENIFRNVAHTFENQIGDKTRWHYELLKRMKLEIEDIRPALISKESYQALDELRRLRHIFRFSYDYELDWERMSLVVKKVDELQGLYKDQIDEFLTYLRKIIV